MSSKNEGRCQESVWDGRLHRCKNRIKYKVVKFKYYTDRIVFTPEVKYVCGTHRNCLLKCGWEDRGNA